MQDMPARWERVPTLKSSHTLCLLVFAPIGVNPWTPHGLGYEIYMLTKITAFLFFGALGRAKIQHFWEAPVVQTKASTQFDSLVNSWKNPRLHAIYPLQVDVDNSDQPPVIIRNGDFGAANPDKIAVNETANFCCLQYLRSCPTGINDDVVNTRRYQQGKPSRKKPFGFTYDNIFRAISVQNACVRQRLESSCTLKKKLGDLVKVKKPESGDDAVGPYIKATAQNYDRYLVDDEDECIAENVASGQVTALSDVVLQFQQQLAEMAKASISEDGKSKNAKDKYDPIKAYERVFKLTAFALGSDV